MKFKVQIRDDSGNLLTEWIVGSKSDGSEVNIVREVEWLREVNGEETNADLLTRAGGSKPEQILEPIGLRGRGPVRHSRHPSNQDSEPGDA